MINARPVAILLVCVALSGFATSVRAESNPAPVADAHASSAPATAAPQAANYGIRAMRPVFGGACTTCPFGSMAKIVKTAMQPYGYEVQICYNCAGPGGPRLVSAAGMPGPLDEALAKRPELRFPPSPHAPVDFGVTTHQWLRWAYEGSHLYKGEGPRKNLRVIATLQYAKYLIVAATKESGITDLRQLAGRPIRLLIGYNDYEWDVLAHYGITKRSIEAAGGRVKAGVDPSQRHDFDVVIYVGTLNNTPEYNIWYQLSQKYDLRYLNLDDTLLDKLAREQNMERRDIPEGLLRGVDRPIPTVGVHVEVIYGRDDMPDSFAYDVAKAIDEHQELLAWNMDNVSYNVHTVWKTPGVPLHPGAERYYREMGYMK
jgi:TRAP transporter TAXI family solute receptor